ncbi:MAG: chromosome segregation protein SMC [Ignavibacteria bacterium]|nr:chromosome segregation protein SMC [Ignavibacteria bacterium]
MYLSKLEIVGFKSFAQKTQLKFNGGISAIVGPNGCGKSNIVDAIRWVLGEQKTSVLRSDVMENVIFNGTKNRKPLSMAEVSLTLENTKGILPSEYSEVTVTRRLFRNGESEYLINKSKCRLKDIVELFMDTGLGADSYSVIELKMVEAILSGRPDERRALFEEAAGIKKYKQRRKEAAKKLETVVEDITRIQDILEEVRKNVASLARQAQKTKRYNNLMSEYKGLDSSILVFNYSLFNNKAEAYKNELIELNKQKIKMEFELGETEEFLRKLKERYAITEEQYNLIIANEASLQDRIASSEKELAVSDEKLKNLSTSKEKIIAEIENAKQSIQSLKLEIQGNEALINEKNKIIEELEEKLLTSKENRENILQELRQLKEESDYSNEKVLSLQNTINSLKNHQNRISDRKKMLERKVQGNFEESSRLKKQIEAIETELLNADEMHNKLSGELSEAENLLAQEKERQTVLQNSIDSVKHKLNDRKNALSARRNTLEYLKSIVDTNQTSQFLINSSGWSKSNDKNQLAELVATDEENITALVSILNYIGDYFVVENVDEATKAINLLKESKKGQASFIAKDIITDSQHKISDADEGKSLYQIIRAEPKIVEFLQNILGNCLIAETDETALKLVREKRCDCCASKTGLFVHKSGYIFGGSEQKNKQSKIGRKEKIEKTQEEIDKIFQEIEVLNEELRNLNEELSLIDLPSLTSNVRQAETRLKNFEQKISQTKLQKQAFEQSLEIVSQSNLQIEQELDEIQSELDTIQSQIEEATEALAKEKEEYNAIQSNLAKVEIKVKNCDNEIRSTEIELTKLNSERNSCENDIKRLANSIKSYENKIKDKEDELLNGDRIAVELKEKTEKIANELIKFREEYEQLVDRNHKLVTEKNSINEQINQYSEAINSLRNQYDKLKEQIHQTDIKISEINVQLNSIKERLSEDFGINCEDDLPLIPEDFDINIAKEKVIELKNKLASLGNVNFLALEEYEKESERLNFYENQINDLLNSEKTLKETIAEINQAAEKNFSETFHQIHENFKRLFKTLFGEEGEAELKIDEGKLLETDIEIIAKPPNKRPITIEQLSQGEKTLTAIALLFAIYLVKPSPFCILDEVDAPLDDSNVDKFLTLIKEFSNNTQFIIVTHNKKTMSAANTLYGITMQEVGVSKTVSVSLEKVENLQ